MGPKAEALMKGPVGRFLVVAEVATLVGAGVIYYQVGDGHRKHRAPMCFAGRVGLKCRANAVAYVMPSS